jgi:thiosulfate/3-mercaptopyruvate sulfurtransferase
MTLVNVEWLAGHASEADLRLCDVRWYLPTSGRRGSEEYARGHVPGAVFIDLDRDLASPDDGSEGRHPLPSREQFVSAMRRAGISADTHVVAYDDVGGAVAARLWWLLRHYGHERVSLLDGGITAWSESGRALTEEVPSVAPGGFHGLANEAQVLSLEAVQQHLKGGGLLLDARAANRYRGETEPVDPRAGHIPGATNLPVSDLLVQGRFLEPVALHAKMEGLVGTRTVAASCGSGVTACHLLFALDHAGVRPFGTARLYNGSFSEWSRRNSLPVALGSEPGVPA